MNTSTIIKIGKRLPKSGKDKRIEKLLVSLAQQAERHRQIQTEFDTFVKKEDKTKRLK